MLELLRRSARRLRVLVRRGAHERVLDEEMRFHVDMEAADLRRAGLPPDEARRQAERAFGDMARYRDEALRTSAVPSLGTLGQDLRYAVRQLRTSPGMAAAVVATLALGVGATTTMYGVRRSETSDALAVASPERVVLLGQGSSPCIDCHRMAPGNFLTIRSQAQALERVSLFADWEPSLRGPERAELVDGVRVTTDFFRTLGIRPLLGRTLAPDDDAPDRQRVVVLTERMWRRHFHGDSTILGRVLVLDRLAYTVVGVVASDAVYPRDTDLWAPLVLTPSDARERERADFRAVGRLRAGATAERAAVELAAIAAQVAAVEPAVMRGTTFSATPLTRPPGQGETATAMLFAAAPGLVLLIACINLAGLLVARLSARRRELAVRRALGAAPTRLVGQLLLEALVLTTLGGVGGALIAAWGSRRMGGVFDGRAFALALALGALSGVAVGLWPALRFARPSPAHELRGAARAAAGDVDTARGRRALVIGEIALAIVLLAAAGLLARSFAKLYAVRPGFDADGVLAVRVLSPPDAPNALPSPARFDRLARTVAAAPGVARAGAVLGVPYGRGSGRGRFEIDGRPSASPTARPTAHLQAATPGYFDALGIGIVRGRGFTDADAADAPRVAIVSRALAERDFPGEDPIGRALVLDGQRWEIVGVAATVFHGDPDDLAPTEIYRPMQQWGRPLVWIVARTHGAPARAARAVVDAVHRFDPDVAITRLATVDALHADDMGSERRMLRFAGAFALAAVLISAIGLYGLVSYAVAQRTREFGVRVALGAGGGALLRLVLGQSVRLALLGAALGVPGAVLLLRAMQSMLFGVSPGDPLTLGAVVAAICAVALLAACVPARRAVRVDPIASLRAE